MEGVSVHVRAVGILNPVAGGVCGSKEDSSNVILTNDADPFYDGAVCRSTKVDDCGKIDVEEESDVVDNEGDEAGKHQ